MTKEFLIKDGKTKEESLATLEAKIKSYVGDRKFTWLIEPESQIFKDKSYRAYARIEIVK